MGYSDEIIHIWGVFISQIQFIFTYRYFGLGDSSPGGLQCAGFRTSPVLTTDETNRGL